MANGKIGTYLGFCIRSGKLVFGVDGAEKLKRDVYLLIADKTLSENSKRNFLVPFSSQRKIWANFCTAPP